MSHGCSRTLALSLLLLTCAVASGRADDASELRLRLRSMLPAVGAHRGGVYRFVPNTLNQFRYARDLGVDIIETDLRATRDGVPIVFHNQTVEYSTHCSGPVTSLTLADLRGCQRKWWALRPPTFEEVLGHMRGDVVVDAEFKDEAVIAPAIDLVRRYHAYGWVYFQATNRTKYQSARRYDPRVGLLFAPSDQADLDWALSLNDDALLLIELHANVRTEENLQRIHQAGKFVSENAWHFGAEFPNHRELFWANCTDVYEHGIDVAVSENPESCLRERHGLRLPCVPPLADCGQTAKGLVHVIERASAERAALTLANATLAPRSDSGAGVDAMHREALAAASVERPELFAKQAAQIMELLEQNTALTKLTQQ